MRAVVVLFPGSNAEAEMVRALESLEGVPTEIVWHKQSSLPALTDLVAIPGGFCHGDYLRPGAIAKASPIIGDIRRHAERGGLVLGVCNGFQVLTEVGLLPGALVQNKTLRFECSDRYVLVEAEGPFTQGVQGVLRLPVAHAEGRYHADPETLKRLEREGCLAFRYCDASGAVTEAANFNGSVSSIAGVYGGARRNVLGLMPHPERAAETFVGNRDGRRLFDAVTAWHTRQA
jgi:phosphoribosylformylglycinamidine synthase subunit PurQ / glutaminase